MSLMAARDVSDGYMETYEFIHELLEGPVRIERGILWGDNYVDEVGEAVR